MAPADAPVCRLMRREDMPYVRALLADLRPTLFSVKSRRVSDAMIDEALRRSSKFAVLVASQTDALLGVAILAWGGRWGRRLFALRHPLALATIVRAQLARMMPSHQHHRSRATMSDRAQALVASLPFAASTDPSWSNEDEGTGRILYIGVEPRSRGKRIGSKLTSASSDHLARVGCSRAIGLIDQANLGSLLMFRSSDWTMVRQGHNVVTYLDLRWGTG